VDLDHLDGLVDDEFDRLVVEGELDAKTEWVRV
jgi:hypothetical protein